MSTGLPPEQNGNTEPPANGNATIGLSEGATAAAAFVDFQETINLVKEQLLGASEEGEGEVRSFDERVALALQTILNGGGEGDEGAELANLILDPIWDHVLFMLTDEDNDSKVSVLQDNVKTVLPAVIESMVNAAGEESNVLKNMNENINMLIHGLHIIGDTVIPHLKQGLVDIQARITSLHGSSIEPQKATEKERTSSGTGNCC